MDFNFFGEFRGIHIDTGSSSNNEITDNSGEIKRFPVANLLN
jgi:hypothetical protein